MCIVFLAGNHGSCSLASSSLIFILILVNPSPHFAMHLVPSLPTL